MPLEPLLSGREQIELIRALLQTGQSVELPVNGSCMRPWAFTQDRIVVESLESRPRVGMIVLSRHRDELFAHRVVRTRPGGGVLTRGDLSFTDDAWVRPADVLGRVVAIRSRFGYVLRLDGRRRELLGLAGARLVRGSLRIARRARRWLSA